MLNKSTLIENLKRIDNNSFEIELFSKFLNSKVKLNVFSGDSTKNTIVISDHLMSCIEDFYNYDDSELIKIQEKIYEDYVLAIKSTEYGMVPEELYAKNENIAEKANQEYFNIKSKEEAFAALTVTYASVVEYLTKDKTKSGNKYVGFFFDRPWDTEHELQIELENGKFKQLL